MFHKSFCREYNFTYSSGIYGKHMHDLSLRDIKGLGGWKNHTKYRLMCLFYACRTQLSISLSGDHWNAFGTEKDQAFYNKDGGRTWYMISVTRSSSDFTGHWLGSCSWSDLCTEAHAPPVWRVWAWPYLAEHWKALCAAGSRFSRCGAIHRLHMKNRDVNG